MQLFNDIQSACTATAQEDWALVAGSRDALPGGDSSSSSSSAAAAAVTGRAGIQQAAAANENECTRLMAAMRMDLAPLNLYNVLEECHHKKKPRPHPSSLPSSAAAAGAGAARATPSGLAPSRKLAATAIAADAEERAATIPAAAGRAAGAAAAAEVLSAETEGARAAEVSAELPGWLKGLRGLDASEAYDAVRRRWKGWPVMGGVAQGSKVHNWGHLLGLDPPCTVSR
jgi:hypothetical protein